MTFGDPALVGVGSWGSPETVADRAILGAVRFGDEVMDLGVTAFGFGLLGGLVCSAEGWSWLLTEYGPAVAGRAVSTFLLPGLIGAPEIPPVEPNMADSGLARTVGAAGGGCDKLETDLAGEKCDMAEPGRVGTVLVVMARFCAIIASRTLGFEVPIVLLDNPRPGRAPPPAS